MKIDLKVPFFSNEADNMHCFQACFKMVLKYFLPDREFTKKDLEKITAFSEKLLTWQLAGVLWMKDKGFEIKNIEIFDYAAFAKDGEEYLLEEFGKEVGRAQIENSNIKQEQILTTTYIQKIKIEKRIPTVKDIKSLLQNDYLIICTINSAILVNKPHYSSHSVVVKGFNDKDFIIHDPGLPPLENRYVGFELFEKAWAYPNEKAKNILAFKF